MVLLVLALIWAAVLVSWLRSRSAETFSDSVGSFRRNLTVLERTNPMAPRSAQRLVAPRADLRSAPHSRPGLGTARTSAARSGAVLAGPSRPRPHRAGPGRAPVSAQRRRQAQKRRRDVFFALVGGAFGFFLLALIPGLSVLWGVQILFDLLLAGYVALLVRIRNVAAERELKLRFLPSRPAAPSYDFAGGYGDLELRRAAN